MTKTISKVVIVKFPDFSNEQLESLVHKNSRGRGYLGGRAKKRKTAIDALVHREVEEVLKKGLKREEVPVNTILGNNKSDFF